MIARNPETENADLTGLGFISRSEKSPRSRITNIAAHTALAIGGVLVTSVSGAEFDEKSKGIIVAIGHLDPSHTGATIELKDRQPFIVQIENSCSSQFDLLVYGREVNAVEKPDAEKKTEVNKDSDQVRFLGDSSLTSANQKLVDEKVALAEGHARKLQDIIEHGISCKPSTSIVSEVLEHNSRYGGYIVEVQRSRKPLSDYTTATKVLAEQMPAKPDIPRIDKGQTEQYDSARIELVNALTKYQQKTTEGPLPVYVEVDGQRQELKAFSTVVLIPEKESWDYIPAGAFLVSKLNSRKYTLGKRNKEVIGTDGTTSMVEEQFVKRNGGADDEWSTGFAGMIHLTHPALKSGASTSVPAVQLAPTFGLAYSNDSKNLGYLFGFSAGLGPAYLTAGYHIGKVDVLPRGLKAGDVVPSGDSLSPAESKTEGAFFFSVSYTFLSEGGVSGFSKPIASAQTPETGK